MAINFDIKKYLKDTWDISKGVADISEKNEYYDYICIKNYKPITIELKERSGDWEDILLEAVQTIGVLSPEQKEKFCTAYGVHKTVGWFYKCEADRLLYVMPSNVYDFDWKRLKSFTLNNFDKKEDLMEGSIFEPDNIITIQYSDLTTGTYNYVIKLKDIPKIFYIKRPNIWKIN